MPCRCSQLQRPLGHPLTANVHQVTAGERDLGHLRPGHHRPAWLGSHLRTRVTGRPQRRHDIQQPVGPQDANAIDERRLACAGHRQHEAARPTSVARLAQGQRHRQGTSHRSEFAAQRQLPGELQALQQPEVDFTEGRQDADGDGQIETAGLLGQVGRREVDRDTLVVGEGQAGVAECSPYALSCLLDLGVGEANEGEGGQSVGEVHLNGDFWRPEPVQRAAADGGKGHGVGGFVPCERIGEILLPAHRRTTPSHGRDGRRRHDARSWCVRKRQAPLQVARTSFVHALEWVAPRLTACRPGSRRAHELAWNMQSQKRPSFLPTSPENQP